MKMNELMRKPRAVVVFEHGIQAVIGVRNVTTLLKQVDELKLMETEGLSKFWKKRITNKENIIFHSFEQIKFRTPWTNY